MLLIRGQDLIGTKMFPISQDQCFRMLWVSMLLSQAEAGNEGSDISIYAETVKTYSTQFLEGAEQLLSKVICFCECRQSDRFGLRVLESDWVWSRDGEPCMIVEHKGRMVFDTYCNEIQNLATAVSVASLPLPKIVLVSSNVPSKGNSAGLGKRCYGLFSYAHHVSALVFLWTHISVN